MENRIKELRLERGMTLKELGEALGVRDNTLSQYETGKRNPQYGFLEEVAEYFDVSVEYLTKDTDRRNYPVKTRDDTEKLLRKLGNNELHLTNLSHLTAIRLSLWILNNRNLFVNGGELSDLGWVAQMVVEDTTNSEQALKHYSSSRKRINKNVDKIDDLLINFEDDYATSSQVLKFIKLSKNLSYENIEKTLKFMSKLPTLDEEEDH